MSTLIDELKKTLDAMETCSEPEVICYAEEIRGIIAEHERCAEALPQDAWTEKDGPVLWWKFPINEPPYAGTPFDDDFGWQTHWTPIPIPKEPT